MKTIEARKPGTDNRPCPAITLTSGPRPGVHAISDGSNNIIDVLYQPMFAGRLAQFAANVGKKHARKQWYTLRRKLLRLEAICARNGYELDWGNPFPATGLAVHCYIVHRGKHTAKVVGFGDVDACTYERADVLLRKMKQAEAKS